ncbi:tRNA-dihydrouridine(20a/20b) synthase [NAD(P)+]-like isoform X2 [Osmia bicornis bicornis]|nr:tRNA-dihydrouridine(20a/20b) synthase [NAD(P)+]-like isoform X2 [Osmia bicornis bicornis]
MILADSFIQSEKARDNEFSTTKEDKPVIVQFAAKTVYDFLNAAEMIAPYCNGVDLNCGCPQRWALKEGYGADLLKKPDLVKDLIYQTRNRIPNPFTVSVKIRLLKDIRKTIEFCQILEKAGVSFLTVHARTPEMRNESINLDSLKLVRDSVKLPLIANGDIKNLENAKKLYRESNCDAVMAARGILTNPALFSGHSVTPLTCIQDWLDITSIIPTQFLCFHHHLVFMLEKLLPKKSRIFFNNLQNKTDVLEFLDNTYGIKPRINSETFEPIKCNFKIPSTDYNKFIANDEDDLSTNFLGNIFVEL